MKKEYIGKCCDIYVGNTLVNVGVCLYMDDSIIAIKSAINKEKMVFSLEVHDVVLNKNEELMKYDSKEKVVSVTKEIDFAAAHYLRDYDGKCKNLHGHNYRLQVTITGTINDIGMVVDFGVIKKYLKILEEVVDHQNLDDVFCFQSTAENMVCFIADFLNARCCLEGQSYRVTKVKLYETPTSFAEWEGEYYE